MAALPSTFDYRGFRIRYECQEGPGADWEFFSLGWDGDPEDRSWRGVRATAGECIHDINEWLEENEAPAGVKEAIAAHRSAVIEDEASFTDEGEPISEARAELTHLAEVGAFRAFASVQCRSSGEVNAKLDYLLYGTVGERDRLLDCLTSDDRFAPDCRDLAGEFLRSLIVPADAEKIQ